MCAVSVRHGASSEDRLLHFASRSFWLPEYSFGLLAFVNHANITAVPTLKISQGVRVRYQVHGYGHAYKLENKKYIPKLGNFFCHTDSAGRKCCGSADPRRDDSKLHARAY
jgi:hypothetical protein